jgi:hypothetical protein
MRGIALLLLGAISAELFPVAAIAGDVKIKVENIRVEQEAEKYVILYDLAASKDESYTVTVTLRREGDPSFKREIKNLSGDVGEGKYAGKDRRVTWDFRTEFPAGLEGDDYFFVVEAEMVSGGISTWVWIGGGVAAAGLAAALLSGKKSDSGPATNQTFPGEPGRPY